MNVFQIISGFLLIYNKYLLKINNCFDSIVSHTFYLYFLETESKNEKAYSIR